MEYFAGPSKIQVGASVADTAQETPSLFEGNLELGIRDTGGKGQAIVRATVYDCKRSAELCVQLQNPVNVASFRYGSARQK